MKIIGIALICICFAVGLLYCAPIVINDGIDIIKEIEAEDDEED